MYLKRYCGILFCALLSLNLVGCATLFEGKTQTISINSSPDGASVKIYDLMNNVVMSGTTPFSATLKRGADSFKKASYRIEFEKAGYAKYQKNISGTANGWFIIGNFFSPYWVGYLIDPWTGCAWEFKPTMITAHLTAEGEGGDPVIVNSGNPTGVVKPPDESNYTGPVIKVAVLDFEAGGGVSKEEIEALTTALENQMTRRKKFRLSTRSEIKNVVGEQRYQELMGCNDLSCAADFGKEIAVERIAMGKVSKLGSLYYLSVQVINVKTAEIEEAFERDHTGGIEGLLEKIREISYEM